jgi:hypothetical protein
MDFQNEALVREKDGGFKTQALVREKDGEFKKI